MSRWEERKGSAESAMRKEFKKLRLFIAFSSSTCPYLPPLRPCSPYPLDPSRGLPQTLYLPTGERPFSKNNSGSSWNSLRKKLRLEFHSSLSPCEIAQIGKVCIGMYLYNPSLGLTLPEVNHHIK